MNTTIQCTKCFNGDLEQIGQVKGYYKYLHMYKPIIKCNACGDKPEQEWITNQTKTVFDEVNELLAKITHLPHIVIDVKTRCIDFLSSTNDENHPYIKQQLRFLKNVIASYPKNPWD